MSSDCIVKAVTSEEDEDELPVVSVDVSVLSEVLSEDAVEEDVVETEDVPPDPAETAPVVPDATFDVPLPDVPSVPDPPAEVPSCDPSPLPDVPWENDPEAVLSDPDAALPDPDAVLSEPDAVLSEPDVLPEPARELLLPDEPPFTLLSAAVVGAVRTNVNVPSSCSVIPEMAYPFTEAILLTSSE